VRIPKPGIQPATSLVTGFTTRIVKGRMNWSRVRGAIARKSRIKRPVERETAATPRGAVVEWIEHPFDMVCSSDRPTGRMNRSGSA
jgi:hypothetical protein